MTMDLEPACGSWLPSSIADAALRFDGEQVTLRAQLRCRLAAGAAGQTLQLLADEDLLLADLELEALQADASGLASINATLALNPPAGQGSRKLSLALVTTHADGTARLQDRWRFALPRRFIQPVLEGAVRLRIRNAMPTLEIDAIRNPHAADTSGTLALELWALERPYRGGGFQGQPLGSVTLGSLAGQQRWSGLRQSWQLPESCGARAGHLTLMLREWTPAGYVTRDWRELDWPRQGSEILINRCSTAALRSLPGISDRLARTIVASRPFAALDDLRRVRGMSTQAYCRLRDRVTI